MSSDIYIKFDGVKGECKSKGYEEQIEVLAWSWDVSNATGASAGGGSGRGKPVPGAFHFTHHYDKASTVLAKNCVAGKHFKDAVVTCRKAGDGQQDYLKVTMKEVFITSIAPSASAGGEVTETLSMSFKDIEFAYKAQDNRGALGGEVKFGWDVATTETR